MKKAKDEARKVGSRVDLFCGSAFNKKIACKRKWNEVISDDVPGHALVEVIQYYKV